jgi:DNA (cytosine-5)-methyltransferase 1
MASTPKIISLFSGMGGLDYGFESAGYNTLAAVEVDRDACSTLRTNRPDWAVMERPIEHVTTSELVSAAGSKDIDLVVGGPPCQPFSKSSYWRGDTLRLDDPRAATLQQFLRVVEEVLPRVLVLENVPGLAYAKKDEALQLLLRGVQAINARHGTNYDPCVGVLDAAQYGVPQVRSRLFMVAERNGRRLNFPAPVYGPGRLPFRTAWDAIGDVVPGAGEKLAAGGKWAALLPSIPEGENYLWHTSRKGGLPLFEWRSRYWSFLLKLAKHLPSWTIQAQPGPATGPFHWTNRRLSERELCRLQTIPDDVVVVGGRVAVQRQIGNAVPSLLSEVVAREIRTQLLDLRPLSPSPLLLPPDRSPAPLPERVTQVPQNFVSFPPA